MMKKKNRMMSMTGYGRGEVDIHGRKAVTEIRSLNQRFLEINIRLPVHFLVLEEAVRKRLQQQIKRGRVDVFITVTGSGWLQKKVAVNWELVEGYIRCLKEIETRFEVVHTVSTADLLRQPDIWAIQEPEVEVSTYKETILQSVEQACVQLIEMRSREGDHLVVDLSKRVQQLYEIVSEIRQALSVAADYTKQRLETRLHELLAGKEIRPERLDFEIANLADKADITEELIRLESHLQQFELTLAQTEPIGRRLDFMIQEMNREVNTISSKAHFFSIHAGVISCKSELEKMKEQVQNIE
jgi:uncharacterized protein (TIGR00255 family)